MKKFVFFLLFFILMDLGLVAQTGFTSITRLNAFPISLSTKDKPQAKVWTYAGKWWCVLATSTGTKIFRLDGTSWTAVLTLNNSNNSRPDCRVVGDLVHVLLYRGTSTSYLYSVQYDPVNQTYKLWSQRRTGVTLKFPNGSQTATLAVDGTGRMWVASDAATTIQVWYSNAPYKTWSAPITIASGLRDDDICAIAPMPGMIGIFWSNQVTKRFGFKTHVDGAAPATWSADEVPASQSAINNVGAGMADDHLNVMVGNNGTLFCAVKTAYNISNYPRIMLLVRRPSGSWDNAYTGTMYPEGEKPIVILNEAQGKVKLVYTAVDDGGDILYRESATSAISFGPAQVLMSGGGQLYDHTTSTHQNYSSEIVLLATNISTDPTQAVGVLAVDGASTPSDQTPPTVVSINRLSPASETTSATSVVFRVSFSEVVTGVGTSDFTLTKTNTATGTIASVSGSGTTYDVTVNNISGSGSIRLDLNSSGTGITDAAGNAINGGFTSGQIYTIQQTQANNLIFAFKSSWQYLDNGSNQGSVWRSTSFNDATWKTGFGEFGYGDGDEATVVSYGPNASNKYITTYFRKNISIPDANAYTYYTARLKRDDGAVVYVNGEEVFRSNIPAGGTVSYTTLASSSSDSTITFNIDAAACMSGTNIIAVEIHQNSASSSDISFDMELIGQTGPPPIEQPKILYYEGFEDGTGFEGFNFQTATPYAFTVVDNPTFAGTKVGRWELRDTDPMVSNGTRAEIIFPEEFRIGESWHSFVGYFPSAEYLPDRKEDAINQWHQGGVFGTPMLMLRTKNGCFEVRRRSADGSTNTDYNFGPILYDQWVEFVVHIKQHLTDGIFQVWINGELKMDYSGPTMFDGPYGRWKIGIYKNEWNNEQTTDTKLRVWYIDEVKLGNALCTYTSMKPVGNQATSTKSQRHDRHLLAVEQSDLFKVYPTVAKRGSVITVKTNNQETTMAFISEISGRVLSTFSFTGTASVDTKNLSSWMYVINIFDKNQLIKQKFLITD